MINFLNNLKDINHWLLLIKRIIKINLLIKDHNFQNFKILILNLSISYLILWNRSNYSNSVYLFVIDIIYLLKLEDILFHWEWNIQLIVSQIMLLILSYWLQVHIERYRFKKVFWLQSPCMQFIKTLMLIFWR